MQTRLRASIVCCTQSSSRLPVLRLAVKQSVRRMSSGRKPRGEPQPSASILLVSPTNHVVLVHRVKTSSAFPSAHVFPGGLLSAEQDGPIPAIEDPGRHRDSKVYRYAAIRECFEECGIILAKDKGGQMLEVEDGTRDAGRKAIHANKVKFLDWIRDQGGEADIDGLIPFTRWITPPNVPKRFTTQMYLYFLPLSLQNGDITGMSSSDKESIIPKPTHDGGLEHTAARFRSVHEWLQLALSNEIILYPPQFFLMYKLSGFFGKDVQDNATLQAQREAVRSLVHTDEPPWTEKVISPLALMKLEKEGLQVLSLERPGPELESSGRSGERQYVLTVKADGKSQTPTAVLLRTEAFDEARRQKRAAQKGLKIEDLPGWTKGTPRL